jgi:hypothetical protein
MAKKSAAEVEPQIETVPMFNPDNGKTADVHPDEVANMKSCGWREVED